jgi:hypothetical protein
MKNGQTRGCQDHCGMNRTWNTLAIVERGFYWISIARNRWLNSFTRLSFQEMAMSNSGSYAALFFPLTRCNAIAHQKFLGKHSEVKKRLQLKDMRKFLWSTWLALKRRDLHLRRIDDDDEWPIQDSAWCHCQKKRAGGLLQHSTPHPEVRDHSRW